MSLNLAKPDIECSQQLAGLIIENEQCFEGSSKEWQLIRCYGAGW